MEQATQPIINGREILVYMPCYTKISESLQTSLYLTTRVLTYDRVNTMMLSPMRSSIWAGALHYVVFVLGAALVTAVVTLVLGVVYGTKLAQAPLEPYEVEYRGAHKYSTL